MVLLVSKINALMAKGGGGVMGENTRELKYKHLKLLCN